MTHLAPAIRQSAFVLTAFLLSGAVAGVAWHLLWDAPTGVVSQGTWNVTSEESYRAFFSATGWFVVLSAVIGVALGAGTGLLTRRRELVSLVSVAVGSVLAALLLWQVGMTLSAPDPTVLARGAADGTLLEGRIAVGGWTPFLVFPIASLFGLVTMFVMVPGRHPAPVLD